MQNLTEWLAVYLRHLADLNGSVHTVERIRSCSALFLDWLAKVCGICAAADLRAAHLHRYQRHLAEYTTARGMPLKPSSLNSRIKSVRSFLDFLHGRRVIPAKLSEQIEYVKEERRLPAGILTHAQTRELLQRIPTDTETGIRDRAALEFLYSTGARISELERLNLEDIDLDTATARLFGKGSKERLVPVGRTAIKWLTSYIRAARPRLLAGSVHTGPQQAVLLNRRGGRWHQGCIRSAIRMHAARAGFTMRITPHTFRRSCTTEMVRANANIYHIKELLGHETLETLKHYAKLNITDLRRTLEKHHPREKDD